MQSEEWRVKVTMSLRGPTGRGNPFPKTFPLGGRGTAASVVVDEGKDPRYFSPLLSWDFIPSSVKTGSEAPVLPPSPQGEGFGVR